MRVAKDNGMIGGINGRDTAEFVHAVRLSLIMLLVVLSRYDVCYISNNPMY
jgi:hypothetical protein